MRVHSPLEAFHEVDGTLAKLFNQEIFLSNSDSMLARTWKLRVDAQSRRYGRDVADQLTSAIKSYGAFYHSVDQLTYYFQLFLIPES